MSEQSRQQAERDVERMRSFVDKREATQRSEEAAERQRQSSERQSAVQQRVYQSGSMNECLRELELNQPEPSRRAELEAICRAKARSEPTLVPVPVYGNPSLMPQPRAHQPPEPYPKPNPASPCPRNDKFCLR